MDHGKEGQSIRWQPQALVAGLLEGLVGAFGTTVQLGKRPHMQRHGRLAVGGRLPRDNVNVADKRTWAFGPTL